MRINTFENVTICFFLLLFLSACNLPSGAGPTVTVGIPSPVASPTVQIVSPTPESQTPKPSITSLPPTLTQSAATQPPAPSTTSQPAGRYSVILVEEGDVLNIRSAAGADNPVVGQFLPGFNNVLTTGATARVGGERWLEVNNPSGGTGWVNAYYLSEYVLAEDFCSDNRVTALLEDFKHALNTQDGDLLASLVSPAHGLEVYYWAYGPSANYNPAEASWVFRSSYKVNWGSGPSGMDDVGTFSDIPLPELLEVVNDPDYEQHCNDSRTASMYVQPWPKIYVLINFYALYKPATPNVDLDWMTWLVGVEYVNARPYLFALKRFVWEP